MTQPKQPDEIVKVDEMPLVEHDAMLDDLHEALVRLSVKVDHTNDAIMQRIALHTQRLEAALLAVSETLDAREAEINRKLAESLGTQSGAASRQVDKDERGTPCK